MMKGKRPHPFEGGMMEGDGSAPQALKPNIPDEWMTECIQALSGVTEASFLPWIADRISVEWLPNDDSRLGMTRFEESGGEFVRRKRLRLDPGEVTIALHPLLLEDAKLYKHTFVHEFLHAAGLIEHSEIHESLTKQLAPSPRLSESPLLQKLQQRLLDESTIQVWKCKACAYEWKRTTLKKPQRCLKCARPM